MGRQSNSEHKIASINTHIITCRMRDFYSVYTGNEALSLSIRFSKFVKSPFVNWITHTLSYKRKLAYRTPTGMVCVVKTSPQPHLPHQ